MRLLQSPKDASKYFLVTHYPSKGECYFNYHWIIFTYFKLCTHGIMKNLSFVVWFLLILYFCYIHHVMCIFLGSIVFILFTDHNRYLWYFCGRMYLLMAFGERISTQTHMFWTIMRPSLSRLNLVLFALLLT